MSEVVTDLARSVDIAPAVLDAAGIAIPEAMIGRSLWTATKLPAYAFAEEAHEGNTLHALHSPTQKRIQANTDNPRGLPPQVLFDLTADPGEEQSLLATQPDQARTMRGELREAVTLALERAVDGERGAPTGPVVGGLLGQLEAGGLTARTLVALTPGHGQEFMEHGGDIYGHSPSTTRCCACPSSSPVLGSFPRGPQVCGLGTVNKNKQVTVVIHACPDHPAVPPLQDGDRVLS